jgi:fructose-1,6-bisphosphatase/inositol monophosphatase family enzyme
MFNRLAAGKIEGAVSCNTEPHDFLAGKLIALEAGAKITHFGENVDTNPNFVMSTDGIHQKLVDLVGPIIKTSS